MKWIVFAASLLVATTPAVAADLPQRSFHAGAVREDITPPPAQLPDNFDGVLDPLYVRALVLDDGQERAALITVDAIALRTETWDHIAAGIERELHIPRERLILAASHSHSVPFFDGEDFENQVIAAVKDAAGRLEPAEMRFGTGVSYINVNRNMIDPETQRWREGPNYDGPSDKSVAVLQFTRPDGSPIAVYYNYAVHGVLTGMLDKVSGDIPGASSRYIEQSLGDGAVALWSMGAAGDQNPIYFQQTYDLRQIRIDDFAARGEDISNTMPPGGKGLDKSDPEVKKLLDQQASMARTMGQMLGEEVLHVMRDNSQRPVRAPHLAGLQKSVTCPGRKRTDSGRAGYPGSYVDSDPVDLRLGVLAIGDTVIGAVDAELFTRIGQHFKQESPYKNTLVVTLANGAAPSGYIPSEEAFGYNTFEVLSSRLKPGCAENAIVEGLIDLTEEVGN
ncbi:neutral/alkaline non-lysosomal ceramidase N-terminal domain-containing protein [Altericroceibacterium endophyticum]|uniref:Neutral/alkaline non-lysosomal ceramidase N-terminal domain-containing protein n=1 Tax=Altericroceibacterium endophyticum TaxID=1808508 RepID=A0A6I4T8H4_9SPHN|nr:neutral/alkaline non-lysosomal ceramidase N-terminal domain-containing protein [Altericroceibacterium endophyticum]MXO66421.1 hypothetical protein [Altericroceibacterium endophyticum]